VIDWLTLKIDAMALAPEAFNAFYANRSRLCLIDPAGNVVWQKPTRESVRSDTHQLTIEFGSELVVYGSPARLASGDADNVFGSDSVGHCAELMVDHVARTLGVQLPPFQRWECTRMDVTENFYLGSLANVKQALEMLRHAEGGRYQLRTDCESVYWSVKSTYRSGKAYGKGAHLDYLVRRGKLEIDDERRAAAAGLLRLELSLRRHWFTRICKKYWFQLSPSDLAKEHSEYFSKLIGDCEVSEMTDLQAHLAATAVKLGLSPGAGRAAFGSWNWIKSLGYQDWRAGIPRATFYRHKKILLAGGLCYADFRERKVVPIRKRRVVLDAPVKSWAELLKAA
jgi:II/X family phage/plasmid replication protein